MKDLLPAYAAGSLSDAEREKVRAHLADCPRCRADLAAWETIADATPTIRPPDPARLVRTVLTRSALESPAERPARRRLRYLGGLVLAEVRLVRLAVPVASALVMALGVALVLLQGDFGPEGSAGLVLSLIAPIVAAAGIAGTYRSRRDPVAELIAAAPTSGRLLLLVRVTLVFGYDLALAGAASILLAVTGTSGTAGLNTLVGAWLGPMALLSSLSLLIAVRFGPDIALGAAVGLWAVRVLSDSVLTHNAWPARLVLDLWSTNGPVLTASVVVLIAAMVLASGEPFSARRATHLL
ncbi:zf-HC2 domain-containing protein [Cryptosporangium phraense]|uniref:Putative zinc-finger domain-containing protein n=1 Tax=Cryptosporangium phraense TaxID=2593070 RepID=A0A545AT37_9ACTN|nr:zf-HC2 domain-containing protein [Cryptosporangium phraense]TQS43765.1 hypothetical protein FL583_17165 [Cryptosporangium phraense]